MLPSVVLATLALAVPATAATAATAAAPSQPAVSSGQAPATQPAATKRDPAAKGKRRRARESSAAWMMG